MGAFAQTRPDLTRLGFRSTLMGALGRTEEQRDLALSALELADVDALALSLTVRGLDLLDGTPVLDIKPYLPYCDSFPDASAGWIDDLSS